MPSIRIHSAKLLNQAEASARMKVTTRTLLNWHYRGIGPKRLDLGPGVVRYRVEDIDAWLAEKAAALADDMDLFETQRRAEQAEITAARKRDMERRIALREQRLRETLAESEAPSDH